MTSDQLTVSEVAARLGVKSGMVRRYALALEAVTGLTLTVDPVRGRLYPPDAVDLLEAARGQVLAQPGQSVEAALRALTGKSEGEAPRPARIPGTLTPADLQAAMTEHSAQVLAAMNEHTARADALAAEVAALRAQVEALTADLRAAREGVERLEAGRPAQPQPVTVQATPPAPDSDPLDGLKPGAALRVTATALPSRLKNDLRWKAARYEQLEEVLRGTQAVTLHRVNGKPVWRTDSGDTMRSETVGRLLGAGVLKIT